MVCPFVNEVVDIEAQIIQRLMRQEKAIRGHLDVLSFFSSRTSFYMKDTVSPHNVRYILNIFSAQIYQILQIVDLLTIEANFMH